MKTATSHLLIVLFACTTFNSRAQTDEAKPQKNFFKVNLTALVLKNYSLQYERVLNKTVSVAVAGYIDCKFYPNPVDHILIVRSDTPIDVTISDANGKVRVTENRVRGLHTINVSSLEKGIYLIRFSNKLINVISQEKLIKN